MQVNLAASFVYVKKEETSASIILINHHQQKVHFEAKRYFQGKDKYLYGPPYTITVGIPKHDDKSSTSEQVALQQNFINLFASDKLSASHLFGSAKYLSIMLNHGTKNNILAWNEAHQTLLVSMNKNSKVLNY